VVLRSLPARIQAPEILVGFLFFASACAAIWLTRIPGGIALFWPSNAIATALLIRLPKLRVYSAFAALLAAAILANLVAGHRTWQTAVEFSAINLAEVGAVSWIFRVAARLPYPDITVGQAVAMSAVFGVAVPGIAAIFGGLVMQRELGAPLVPSVLQWWSSQAVGACLFGPPIILFSKKSLHRLTRRRFLVQNLLALLFCIAGCYLAIGYVRFPFVLIGVLLSVAAFRVGGFGASVLSLCTGLTVLVLWALGLRPIGLELHREALSLAGLPVVALFATLLPPITVGLGSDARRGMARALRVSERRFRESMDRSPVGTLISDLEGRWVYSNLALQKMLGYSAEEFRALPPGGPSNPDDWKASAPRRQRLIAGEVDHYEVDRRFQHKDGHWVWTHMAISLVRDEDGVPVHLISQIESLEARRRAEANLAEERERLKITLQSIGDAVIQTDAQTRITYVNAAAQSLLGLELQDVEGRRFDEVIYLTDPYTSKTAANLIGRSAVHGKAFRRQNACLLHRPDGTVCYVSDVVSPVLDASNLVNGMVVVLRDASQEFHRARDLEHRAIHDPLTGLVNRSEFERRLRDVFVRTRLLQDRPAVLLAIDLDLFKAVNDAGGHAAGDAMLRKVAETCRRNVRVSDLVARVGGDEFAIILDNCPEERARAVAEQLLAALNPLNVEWEGSSYDVGACIGLAVRSPFLANEQEWMASADKACYCAKREGRAQLRVAPPLTAASAPVYSQQAS
jgi:diguanylate cyclase